MDIERLKEDIESVESDLEYGEYQDQGKVAVNVECLRSVIDFANEAIARQSVTDEAVKDAIEWVEEELNDAIKYQLNDRACAMDTSLIALRQMHIEPCELLNYKINYKKCSKCDGLIHVYVPKQKFCPNCGRKIKEN